MSGYGLKEARINRERQARVNLCGSCGTAIDQDELLCTDCKGEPEVDFETRGGGYVRVG
jgi:hypothetical protein